MRFFFIEDETRLLGGYIYIYIERERCSFGKRSFVMKHTNTIVVYVERCFHIYILYAVPVLLITDRVGIFNVSSLHS